MPRPARGHAQLPRTARYAASRGPTILASGRADVSKPDQRSVSMPGECLSEHREIAVMSQAQISELISGEPPDGSRSSVAALAGVPVQVSTSQICMVNVSARISPIGGPTGRATSIPSSSRSSRTSDAAGSSPGSTWPPGKSQRSGYRRRWADRWHSSSRLPFRRSAVTMCAGATLCVECDTCGFCHVEPPLCRLANGYSSAALGMLAFIAAGDAR
jgi:hypothetical protein